MEIITSGMGPQIMETGTKMIKKPNPVYMIRKSTPFQIQTDRGLMEGNPGDYIAYDPVSGQVWPVSPEYVEQHYDEWGSDNEEPNDEEVT